MKNSHTPGPEENRAIMKSKGSTAPKNTPKAATGSVRNYRRRKCVVNAAFQWKYALTLASVVFVLVLMLSAALYGVLHDQARLRTMDPAGYTAEVGLVMLCFGGGFATVAAVGLGVWSLLITRRICGPLSLLGRYFQDLQKGIIPSPRALRRKDEFKELFAEFATGMSALRSRTQSDLATLTVAERMIRSIEKGDAAACGRRLDAVATRLTELRKRVAHSLGEQAVEIGYENQASVTNLEVSELPIEVHR